jgi:hypothetical protein
VRRHKSSAAGNQDGSKPIPSTKGKHGIDLLPRSWRQAFLLGPWVLMLGGFALVVASFISSNRSSFGTTCLTLGVATAVAGALLPRASGQFSVAGATANVYGVEDAIKAIAEIASATVPDSDPAKEEKVRSYVNTAAGILSNSPSVTVRSPGDAAMDLIEVPVSEAGTTRTSSVSLTELVSEVFGAR